MINNTTTPVKLANALRTMVSFGRPLNKALKDLSDAWGLTSADIKAVLNIYRKGK